jgi:hypothetical protein
MTLGDTSIFDSLFAANGNDGARIRAGRDVGIERLSLATPNPLW